MSDIMLQAELAYRRERIEATMRQVGPSRRQRRRKAAALAAELTLPRPRRSPEDTAGGLAAHTARDANKRSSRAA